MLDAGCGVRRVDILFFDSENKSLIRIQDEDDWPELDGEVDEKRSATRTIKTGRIKKR
jgi:hypothetical protein